MGPRGEAVPPELIQIGTHATTAPAAGTHAAAQHAASEAAPPCATEKKRFATIARSKNLVVMIAHMTLSHF